MIKFHRREIIFLTLLRLFLVLLLLSLAGVGAVIAHNLLRPMSDPVAPLALLDRASLWLGVHSRASVLVLDLAPYSSAVYAYAFQRRVADASAFALAEEGKRRILPGLFSKPDVVVRRRHLAEDLDARVEEVAAAAEAMAPEVAEADDSDRPAAGSDRRSPVLVRVSPRVLDGVGVSNGEELARVVGALAARLRNSTKLAFAESNDESGKCFSPPLTVSLL